MIKLIDFMNLLNGMYFVDIRTNGYHLYKGRIYIYYVKVLCRTYDEYIVKSIRIDCNTETTIVYVQKTN